jgi:hypothetical protein
MGTTTKGIPLGAPAQTVPKSECNPVPLPIAPTQSLECEETGACEMSVFHTLSGGNMAQPPSVTTLELGVMFPLLPLDPEPDPAEPLPLVPIEPPSFEPVVELDAEDPVLAPALDALDPVLDAAVEETPLLELPVVPIPLVPVDATAVGRGGTRTPPVVGPLEELARPPGSSTRPGPQPASKTATVTTSLRVRSIGLPV